MSEMASLSGKNYLGGSNLGTCCGARHIFLFIFLKTESNFTLLKVSVIVNRMTFGPLHSLVHRFK